MHMQSMNLFVSISVIIHIGYFMNLFVSVQRSKPDQSCTLVE